jgi:hypothetical protein
MRQSNANGEASLVTLTRLCNLTDVSEGRPCRAEIDGLGYAVFRRSLLARSGFAV